MAITMTDFTNDVSTDNNYNVTGDGIFDDMMEAVNSNIKAQYDAGRITGSDYASVYLGAIQTAISQSVQVMLNKALVDAQVVSEEVKTDLINVQIQEEQYKLSTLLPDEHILNNKKEIQLDGEIAYIAEKTTVLSTSNAKDLEVKDAQIGKVNSDKALIDAQKAEIPENAISNRSVKAKDLEVKEAQKELYIRQKQSLNDSLLKDLYKEASGGTAMVYSELDGAISTPNSWNKVDEIANQILVSAGSTYQFTVQPVQS